MHAIKSLKNKPITILLSVVIAVSLIFGAVAAITKSARAETVEDTKEYAPTSLGISNPDFSESSGDYPATPTSWSGAAVDNGKGELVKGVVDLTPSVYSTGGNEKYMLDQYSDEYANETEIPKTIFGKDTRFGGDAKALLINTVKGASAAYAYSSSEMSLNPNSFYRFSVWVKTGDFAGQSGATVKLSGLGRYFGFGNINTVKNNFNDDGELALDATNNYGWVKYSLYVRTSASLTKTVKLNLGLGDAVVADSNENPETTTRPAKGYAFFDTVKAERISAYTFATETLHLEKANGKDDVYGNGYNVLAIDLNETKSFTTKEGKEIGTFSENTEEWKTNIYYDENSDSTSYVGSALSGVYNSKMRFDLDSSDNIYGFTKSPWAPYGRAEYDILDKDSPFFAGKRLANIMLISTYDGNEFGATASGVASPFVTVERFKYYRFSVWVKGDGVEGGNGIGIRVKGKPITGGTNTAASLLTQYTGLSGDDSDAAHYGWKEQIVYIHGSMLYDYDVSFELWLGSPDSQSKGIAMFDNATFTELKYSDYSEMSAADSGNVYTIDDIENDTNINNGNFLNVGDMDEIKFPMPVAEWTYHTPTDVETKGFSNDEVDTEHAVHGILPTDKDTFNQIAASGAIPYVDRPNVNGLNNVLLLSSVTKTAFCYQSPSITIATDKANKLTVDMCVGNVDGYGASLVLKTTDGNVLSTIENITDTAKKFRTYTFYLAAPLSDQTVYLEIWLGLNDRKNNTQKLSSGNVYVSQVALNEWKAADNSSVDAEFKEILEQYKFAVTHESALSSLDYGVYSFTSPSLDYFDAYSYNSGDELGIPYQWNMTAANSSSNVIYGMFNPEYRKNENVPYAGFKAEGLTGNMLYIFNTEKNYTKYTYDNSLALVSNKYYRIDVKVKVRVDDEVRKDKNSVGANIALTGSTAEFTNIKDTTTLVDVKNEDSRNYESFKTYSFYIATGDNGGSIGLEISFGGTQKDNYIQGKLVVGGIEMTEIDNLDYEAAQKSKDKNVIAVELSETNTDKDDNNTEAPSSEIQWWIIPTIIFSVALIAVIALIVVVKIRDRIRSKRKVTYSTEYDRSDVMNSIDRLKAQEEIDRLAQEKAQEQSTPIDVDEEKQAQSEGDDEQTEGETDEQPEQKEAPAKPAQKPDDTDLDD